MRLRYSLPIKSLIKLCRAGDYKMSDYNPRLAIAFSAIACQYSKFGLKIPEDCQAVAYISRVSMELSLKAALSQAGIPEYMLKELSHSLSALMRELDSCTVEAEIAAGTKTQCAASRIRGKTFSWNGFEVSLGAVIDAELAGASKFPGAYRYGPPPVDFPAEALAQAAYELAAWVDKHWSTLRRSDACMSLNRSRQGTA